MTALTLDQKRSLYRDGYVIVRNAVAPELVEGALARIRAAQKGENLGSAGEMTDLVNASSITPLLTEAMGMFDPPIACITVYQMPHSGTRNECGTESRKSIIFRIRNKKRQPDKRVKGVSDHPDRGQMGEWLEYEDGNDPWERSKYAMCNMWHEWDGMQGAVSEERGREAGSGD